MTKIAVQDLRSAIYWATRCDQIFFRRECFHGVYKLSMMIRFEINVICLMLQEGYLTSLYKKDIKELKIQLALGTLNTMKLILIPTLKAYKMYSKDDAYKCTKCKQI